MTVLESALGYQQSGLSVIPTGTNKRPRLASWAEYQKSIASPETIQEWFQGGNAQIAVIAGKISENLEVLDFDAQGEQFKAWVEIIKQENPALYNRLTIEQSPSGGFHVAYRSDLKIPGNSKLSQKGIEVSGQGEYPYKEKTLKAIKQGDKWFIIAELIETRGEGGYCLVAPSKGYSAIQGNLCAVPVLTAAERALLIDTARSLNQWILPINSQQPHTKANSTAGQKLPGQDFDERGDLTEILLKHAWTRTGRSGTVNGSPAEYWRRPGKTQGHSATLIDGRTFYVFSSNGYPFETGKAYGPFGVYTILEHQGDFTRAAQELAKQGYGTKTGSTKARAQGRSLNDLLQRFSGTTEYLWRQHLPKGMPTTINGREGAGKSSVCLAIAREILQQNPDGIIYWVASEGFVSDTVVKANALGLPLDGPFRIAEKPDGTFRFDLRFTEDRNLLAGLLDEVKDRLLCVFIDSIRGMTGGDDNDPKTGSVMHQVNSIICDRFGTTLVYIDHHKKGKAESLLDRSVGTTAKTAAVRVVLSILPASTYTRKIVMAKSNVCSTMPALKSIQIGDNIIISEDEDTSEQTLQSKVEHWLLSLFAENPSLRAAHIYEQGGTLGFSDAIIKKAKGQLGIKSEKRDNLWFWSFPIETRNSCNSYIPCSVSNGNHDESKGYEKGYSSDTEGARDTRDTRDTTVTRDIRDTLKTNSNSLNISSNNKELKGVDLNYPKEDEFQREPGDESEHEPIEILEVLTVEKDKNVKGGMTMEERCAEGLGCEWYQVAGRCRAGEELLRMANGC